MNQALPLRIVYRRPVVRLDIPLSNVMVPLMNPTFSFEKYKNIPKLIICKLYGFRAILSANIMADMPSISSR